MGWFQRKKSGASVSFAQDVSGGRSAAMNQNSYRSYGGGSVANQSYYGPSGGASVANQSYVEGGASVANPGSVVHRSIAPSSATSPLGPWFVQVNVACFPVEARVSALKELVSQLEARRQPHHDVELLQHGGANILYQKLAVCLSCNPTHEELVLICSALELLHIASDEALQQVFEDIGREALPLLTKVLQLPFKVSLSSTTHNGRTTNTTTSTTTANLVTHLTTSDLQRSGRRATAELKASVQSVCKVLASYSLLRVAQVSLVASPDLLKAITCVMDRFQSGMTETARYAALAVLANISQGSRDTSELRYMLKHPKFVVAALQKMTSKDESEMAQQLAMQSLANLGIGTARVNTSTSIPTSKLQSDPMPASFGSKSSGYGDPYATAYKDDPSVSASSFSSSYMTQSKNLDHVTNVVTPSTFGSVDAFSMTQHSANGTQYSEFLQPATTAQPSSFRPNLGASIRGILRGASVQSSSENNVGVMHMTHDRPPSSQSIMSSSSQPMMMSNSQPMMSNSQPMIHSQTNVSSRRLGLGFQRTSNDNSAFVTSSTSGAFPNVVASDAGAHSFYGHASYTGGGSVAGNAGNQGGFQYGGGNYVGSGSSAKNDGMNQPPAVGAAY